MQQCLKSSCFGQVAILRLAVLGLAAIVLFLLWNTPDPSGISHTELPHVLGGESSPFHDVELGEPGLEESDISKAGEIPVHEAQQDSEGSENDNSRGQNGMLNEHPIKTLSKKGAIDLENFLARQSNTFEQAEAEYIRRYKRSPPPGFRQWFEYAKAENSLIIDDFDIIDQAIAPYLEYNARDILENVQQLVEKSAWSWTCRVEKGRLQKGCETLGEEIMILFADVRILAHLPDVEFAVNYLDEPRILLKRKSTSLSSRHLRQRSESEHPVEWKDLTHMNAWKELAIERCSDSHESHPHRELKPVAAREVETLNIPFVQDRANAMDICQHPEYEHLHGFWESSASLRVTDRPLPILSPGVLSTMNDIPFPAIAYTQRMYSYEESETVDYDKKTPGLYWAGKSTGGYLEMNDTDDDWISFHRQRLVSLANDIDQKPHTYLQRTSGGSQIWEGVTRERLNASTYHVHFTGIVQCNEAACKHQEDYFGLYEPDGRGEAGKFTLVFDVDGNGHSARYYRLLQSKSLPLKQTVFREWHDDRLQPWVHFVPISLGMEELPEVVRYLVEEEEGRELARELAMKGREYSMRVLRPVDQVIYLYRLLLELARLSDPGRSVSVR